MIIFIQTNLDEKIITLNLYYNLNFTMTNGRQNEQQQLLRHVVMFGWKEGIDTNSINKIVTAFKELPSKISFIKSFEWGTNNSPENKNEGLTHCFVITFADAIDRDAYLIDPAHKEFVSLLKPAPDKVTVLDYWVKT